MVAFWMKDRLWGLTKKAPPMQVGGLLPGLPLLVEPQAQDRGQQLHPAQHLAAPMAQ